MEGATFTPERCSPRLSATIPISLLAVPGDNKTKHDAWMVDISPEGARVRTPQVLLAGQTVGIVSPEDIGQTISYRVVWVERSSSGCVAGLALIDN